MADIKITYETLFDLLRRERNREELQALDKTFYADVLIYLREKQALTQQDAMTASSEKARIQFHNIKRILKELYDRREKKLVLLALNTVRTGTDAVDKETLLEEERLLFSDLVTTFRRYRKEVLESLLNQSTPFGNATTPKPSKEPDSQPAAPAKPAPKEESAPSPAPKTGITIKFVKAVPRFAGADEQVFGPYNAGDEASLPEKIATILIKKGRAEQA